MYFHTYVYKMNMWYDFLQKTEVTILLMLVLLFRWYQMNTVLIYQN